MASGRCSPGNERAKHVIDKHIDLALVDKQVQMLASHRVGLASVGLLIECQKIPKCRDDLHPMSSVRL